MLALPSMPSYSFISNHFNLVLPCVSLALPDTHWNMLAHPGTWHSLAWIGTHWHALEPSMSWNLHILACLGHPNTPWHTLQPSVGAPRMTLLKNLRLWLINPLIPFISMHFNVVLLCVPLEILSTPWHLAHLDMPYHLACISMCDTP